ncbi:MAG: hypothetical protein OCU22_07830 [Canidatus Methanoxibalbensis ujae]|nr:hypothetical protein [Candidatus Methanoxibalbensis ujae]
MKVCDVRGAAVLGVLLFVMLSGVATADKNTYNACCACGNEDLTAMLKQVEEKHYANQQEKIKAEEEILRKIRIEKEKQRFEELNKSGKIQAGIAYVSIYEWYDYNLGGTLKYTPSFHIYVSNFGDVNEILLKLKLPRGINPVLSGSDVPVEYKYDDSTGIMYVNFTDIPECEDYIWADFELEKFSPALYPITNNPKLIITPADFGPNSSGYVNVSIGEVNLDGIYDYVDVEYEVYDVKNISVVSTMPTADWTLSHNDTYCYCGDCHSYAYAHWCSYDVSSLPAHSANFSVRNDCDEVDVSIWMHFDKYTGENVKVIDVSIPHSLWQYADIDIWHYQSLNPVNPGDKYGIITGKVYDKWGNVVPYATVYAYNQSEWTIIPIKNNTTVVPVPSPVPPPPCRCGLNLYTVTDQNGRYAFKVPPGQWYIYAYSEYFSTPTSSVNVTSGVGIIVNLYGNYTPIARITIEPIDTALDTSVSYNVTVENIFDDEIYVSLDSYAYVHRFNETMCWWESFKGSSDFVWSFSDNYFYLKPGESKTIRAKLTYIGTEPLTDGKYKEYLSISVEANDIWNWYGQYVYFFRGVDCEIYTDKASYREGDVMKVGLKVLNSGTSKNADVCIWLENSAGVPVYILGCKCNIRIPAGIEWNNPNIASFVLPRPLPCPRGGTYSWHVAFVDTKTDKIIARDSCTFTYKGKATASPFSTLEDMAAEGLWN